MRWFHARRNWYSRCIVFSRPTKKSSVFCIQCSSTPWRRHWWNVSPSTYFTYPSTAGVLTTYASWRWAFYLQGILTACFVVAVFFFVPNDHRQITRREPIDWFGALLVSGGLCALCFSLTDGETSPEAWATSYIIASLVLGVLCLALFVWLQARLQYPLLHLSIFRYPQFPRVIMTYFLGFTTFAGVLVFNYTLMWQLVDGRKAVGVKSSYVLADLRLLSGIFPYGRPDCLRISSLLLFCIVSPVLFF
jgi:MFS family permease